MLPHPDTAFTLAQFDRHEREATATRERLAAQGLRSRRPAAFGIAAFRDLAGGALVRTGEWLQRAPTLAEPAPVPGGATTGR